MQTLALSNYGKVEMNLDEQKEADGGIQIIPWVAGAIVALAISAINNWGDIREGWSDGINGKPPRH